MKPRYEDRTETEIFFDEKIEDYSKRLEVMLEWNITTQKAEETYYGAKGLLDTVQDTSWNLDEENIEALEQRLETYEENYFENETEIQEEIKINNQNFYQDPPLP